MIFVLSIKYSTTVPVNVLLPILRSGLVTGFLKRVKQKKQQILPPHVVTLIFNTLVSDCSDLHLCVSSCVLDTDSLSWWHNSQVWDLGHSWAREVPQFSPHVLQRCTSCNCCLRYHKPGMHVYFSIMCNSLWWWLLEVENKKHASVHHIHSGWFFFTSY